MDLADLHRAYGELLARYRAGEITEQAFLDRVGALRAQDEQGRWWTISARTGEWYVAQQGEWVQADPPAEVGTSGGARSQFCPECGAPVAEGATFCGQCGHRMGGHRMASSVGAAGAEAYFRVANQPLPRPPLQRRRRPLPCRRPPPRRRCPRQNRLPRWRWH